MLPTLIYEPVDSVRSQLADALRQIDSQGAQRLRVDLSTGSLGSLERAIDAASGITMTILGVQEDTLQSCAALASRLMEKSASNYVLFCLHDIAVLQKLFAFFLRPAGILTLPLEPRSATSLFNRILRDFDDQTAAGDSDEYLMIEANNTVYRLELSRVHYLEALDKLLTIHTDQQNITVRKSLSQLGESLSDRFVRCHRAYIVNRHSIASVDFSQMTVTLKNGEALPMSRGQRAEVRQAFEAAKGGA